MRLYLVRHGQAVHEQVDPKRPLSQEGRAQVEVMARFMASLDFDPREIFHSVKVRTKETAQIIQKGACPKAKIVERQGLRPNDSTKDIYNEIQKRNGDVLIVGHLPFLPLLVSRLTINEERTIIALPPSGLIMLESTQGKVWYLTGFVTVEMLNAKGFN